MNETDALQAAIGWHLRLPEADETVWARFIDWLEADPAHAAAYDEISMADRARVLRLEDEALPANDNEPQYRRWLVASLAALAVAGLATALALHPTHAPPPTKYTIVAAADQPQPIIIGSGARVRLEPGAQLTLDRADHRFASLVTGRAHFDVTHEPTHPFRVELGAHSLVDTGTVFDVEMTPDRIAVAVERGGVTFDPATAAVAIAAGQRLEFNRSTNTGQLSTVNQIEARKTAPATLSFRDAPFADVTAALASATGERISLDNSLKTRRFTGVVKLTGSAARDVPRFAEATGIRSTRDGDHWVLSPTRDDPR